MTRQTRNSEINTSADSLVGKDGEDTAVLQQTAERTTRQDLALAADNQTALVENRVIPSLQIQNDTKGTSARGDWASARVEARQESERNISAGNPIHTIRYGDTLWDVAAASFKTNNGHKASAAEILGEVTRLTQKNSIANPNNIPLGTKIDTSPDGQKARQRDVNETPNYYDFSGRPRTEGPNYYQFNGRPANSVQNYSEFRGRQTQDVPNYYDPARQPARVRLPEITPQQTNRDLPITQRDRSSDNSYTNRSIDTGGDTTPQAKNSAAWRNSHSALAAKASRGAPRVAFYGDSITHGLQLNPNFKSFGGGSENFGIDGDRTENLLYRLKDGEANFPGRKPESAVLLIGTNNIGSQSPDKIAAGILANAKEMANRMPQTEIVVMGVLPRGNANDPIRSQINAINESVRRKLDGVPGVKFVDIGPQLLDGNGNMKPGVFQPDKVHLSYNAGYSAMLRALQPHLRSRR